MDDAARLAALVKRLNSIGGLRENEFRRIGRELDRAQQRFGYDESGRLKIAVYDARSYDIDSLNRYNAGRFAIHYIAAPLDIELAGAIDGYRAICIFVNDICDAGVVAALAARGVELIALRCAGYNNVDLKACQEHGIAVVRVPAYSPYAVAEHTVGLMLMLNRHLHQAYLRNRTGNFVLEGLTGFDMHGRTVGVIGTGAIGVCVVRILLGFGCRVLAFDKFPNQELVSHDNVAYVELDRLLSESDVITLHVPLFSETHHIIDAAAIEKMKAGVMVINTSRGGLVDTRALIDGLKSGKIGWAGLDVYEEEAGVFFHDMTTRVLTDDILARLLTFNNVVVTSHQAFLTREALSNIAETTLASVAEFQEGRRGEQLTHAVDDNPPA